MKADNPFTLNFGKQPSNYVSRYEESNAIISSFAGDDPISQIYLIEGLRGSGKTVLMTAVSNELQETGEWVVADLLPTVDLLDDLANRLSDIARSNKHWLPSGMTLSVGGTKLEWKDQSLPQDNRSIIDGIIKALVKKKKKILITIDEVTMGQNMRDFGTEFQSLVRKNYPVFLIMTGLHENIHHVQNDKSLTFLLRSPKITLEPLSVFQITTKYESALQVSAETAKNLAAITKGYAFAFQVLGLLYYEKKASDSLEDIYPKMDEMVAEMVVLSRTPDLVAVVLIVLASALVGLPDLFLH